MKKSEISIIIVAKNQFYIPDADHANLLQSETIKSYPLTVFSSGISSQNKHNKGGSGPWRLLPEDCFYLFNNLSLFTKDLELKFYSCDDAKDLPKNHNLKNETPKNSYKIHKSPIEFEKELNKDEITEIFRGCIDEKLYSRGWLKKKNFETIGMRC